MELLSENITWKRLLTIFIKSSITDIWQGPQPRWGYTSTIYLAHHFEFTISYISQNYVCGYSQTCLGPYKTSINNFFFAKFEQFSQKILRKFRQSYLRICTLSIWRCLIQIWNCFHKGFYDRTVFHNTDWSYF